MARIFWLSLALPLALALASVAPLARAEPRTLQLEVKGMNCASCPLTVRLALRKTAGVIDAKVTLEPPLAIVTFEAAKTTPELLMRATTNAGYPSSLKAAP